MSRALLAAMSTRSIDRVSRSDAAPRAKRVERRTRTLMLTIVQSLRLR